MFYIENFALRLTFLLVLCIAVVNLAAFIRYTSAGDPFAFDVVRQLLFPVFLAVTGAVLWKPSGRK